MNPVELRIIYRVVLCVRRDGYRWIALLLSLELVLKPTAGPRNPRNSREIQRMHCKQLADISHMETSCRC